MVTPTQQRAAAEYLCQEYEASQRRVSAVLGRARSTLRYTPKGRSEDKPLGRGVTPADKPEPSPHPEMPWSSQA